MAKLILSMDGLVLKEIRLNQGRLSIGRKPHNDIQIDNMAISGEHAVITCILADAFLEDLNSTNGTLVNGQPVSRYVLRRNDVIELGKYKLKYLVEPQADSPGRDFERKVAIRSVTSRLSDAIISASTEAVVRSPLATAAPTLNHSGPPAAAVQLLNGPNAGREIELNQSLTTLGKHRQQVAVITRRPQGYYLTHVEGALFPSVNGRTLDALAYLLSDHDIIEIAGVKMEFFLKAR